MLLYNYFRSSASYRVRIALNLKGLAYDYAAVNLQRHEQLEPCYDEISAAQAVPMLQYGASDCCGRYPTPPPLPMGRNRES